MKTCAREIGGAGMRRLAVLVVTIFCMISPRVWGQEGVAASKKGDEAQTIAACTRAIELNPKSAKAFYNRGCAYEVAGHDDQAIIDLNQAIQLDPKLAAAYFHRGNCYFAENSYGLASADFTSLIDLKPKDAEAYNSRGTVYYQEGDCELALMDFNRAVRLRPTFTLASDNQRRARLRIKNDPLQLLRHGIDVMAKGNNDEAIADFSNAIFLEPTFLLAYMERGDAYRNKKEYARALADHTKVIQLDPKNAVGYVDRSGDFRDQHDDVKALADLDQVIQLAPKEGFGYYHRALLYRDAKEDDKAIADFGQAIQFDPGPVVSSGIGKPDNVYPKVFEGFFVIYHDQENPHYQRGLIYERKGDLDRALGDMMEAIRLDPKAPDPYYQRATIYFKKGDAPKALADFQQILTLTPEIAVNYNNLAWYLATSPEAIGRNGAKALEYAMKACDFSHWNEPMYVDTLAAACAEMGDFENAVKWERSYLKAPKLSPGDIADARSRLALYQAHQPYRVKE